MKNPNSPDPSSIGPPFSSFTTLIDELVAAGFLSAPDHPGILARLDHYEIHKELGRGGMGIVLLARDTRSEKEVAIKLIRPELAANPEVAARFLREAKRLYELKDKHAHLLPVLEVVERAKAAYFVMPYCKNGSLRTVMSAAGSLSTEQILTWVEELASALQFLHKRPGFVHHDLKPENVLINGEGKVQLADFGLARHIVNDSFVTPMKGRLEGTAPYMSPAVAAGEEEDTRYDIYSFGALLYEMLTGRAPYTGPDSQSILEQIKAGPPKPILQLNPAADRRLVAIAEKAMARNLRDRYAEMADICQDLARARGGGNAAQGRSRRVIFASVGVSALLIVLGGYYYQQLGYELVTTRRIACKEDLRGMQLGDRDGDAKVDFIYPVQNKIQAVLNDGSVSFQDRPSAGIPDTRVDLPLLYDGDKDGLQEAFVSWTVLDPPNRMSHAFSALMTRHGAMLRKFSFPGGYCEAKYGYGEEGTALHPVRVVDLDGDGREELIAKVVSGRAKRRGIACFDYETGRTNWFFEMGPVPMDVEVRDINGDHIQEILVGSNASSNNNRVELEFPTTDLASYVFVLGFDGRLRWGKELGGAYSTANPVPSVKGQPKGILVFLRPGAFFNGQGPDGRSLDSIICRYDANGEMVSKTTLPIQLTSALSVDLNADGKEEVLASDRNGFLHVYDHELRIIRKPIALAQNTNNYIDLQILGAANLVGDPSPELVFRTSNVEQIGKDFNPGSKLDEIPQIIFWNDRLLVLDKELNILASRVLHEKLIEKTRSRGMSFILPRDQAEHIVQVSDPIEFMALRKRFF